MGVVAKAELMSVEGSFYRIVRDETVISEIMKYVSDNIPTSELDAVYVTYVHKGAVYTLVYDLFRTWHVLQDVDYEHAIVMDNKYGVSC